MGRRHSQEHVSERPQFPFEEIAPRDHEATFNAIGAVGIPALGNLCEGPQRCIDGGRVRKQVGNRGVDDDDV